MVTPRPRAWRSTASWSTEVVGLPDGKGNSTALRAVGERLLPAIFGASGGGLRRLRLREEDF
jgi:hypothetical protein